MPNRRAVSLGLISLPLAPRIATAQTFNAGSLWWDAVFGATSERRAALATIVARGQPDMAAGLILGMRFVDQDTDIVPALRAITEEPAASTWFDWMLWQEAHPEVIPHPDFVVFMRDLHLRIDPAFDVFLQPDALRNARIRIEEIVWGGVVKDGIPALDNPTLIAADAADYMHADDLVFGVQINGDARAYPLRIMGWHEMFNDVVGGVPVSLAYCTLCGSGILFDGAVPGRAAPFTFGSSGFLYRSNKLMYDRATLSLWNQFTGEPVVGPLVGQGIVLTQRPVVITRWDDWTASHPDTQVLSLDTGFNRDYGSGVVYSAYFASDALMFPSLGGGSGLAQKDYVFGIRRFGGAKAWPLTVFAGGRVLNDAVADWPVVLIGDANGRTVRAYAREDRQFAATSGQLSDQDGGNWTVGEEALIGPNGQSLPREAGHVAYWFAWNSYLGAESELFSD